MNGRETWEFSTALSTNQTQDGLLGAIDSEPDQFLDRRQEQLLDDSREKIKTRRFVSSFILWMFAVQSVLLFSIVIAVFYFYVFRLNQPIPNMNLILSILVGGTLTQTGVVFTKLAEFAYKDLDYRDILKS